MKHSWYAQTFNCFKSLTEKLLKKKLVYFKIQVLRILLIVFNEGVDVSDSVPTWLLG